MDDILKTRLAATCNRLLQADGYLRLLRGTRAYAECLRELGIEEGRNAQGDVVLGRPRAAAEREPVELGALDLDELRALALHAYARIPPGRRDLEAWAACLEHADRELRDAERDAADLAARIRYARRELAGAVPGAQHSAPSAEDLQAIVRRDELDLELARGKVESLAGRFEACIRRVEQWREGRGDRLNPQRMARAELLAFLRRAWPATEEECALVVWSLRAERAGCRGDREARDRALVQVAAWGGACIDAGARQGTP